MDKKEIEEAKKELSKLCIDILQDDNLENYDNTSPFERMNLVKTLLNYIEELEKELGETNGIVE